MSKAVLISIQPKWCELIAKGKKTVEVRKSRPKTDTPFKVYIYATNPKNKNDLGLCLDNGMFGSSKEVGFLYKRNYETAKQLNMQILSGKVIGEFVCDCIISHCEMANADIAEQQGCIKRGKLLEYSNGKGLYGWHISDLKIYDKPRELSEFRAICRHYDDGRCGNCEYYDYANNESYRCEECAVDGLKPITKAPQSWCYVEECEENGST